MPNYSKMTDKVNNRKIQVESAVRDGEGNKISTRYITSDGYYPQLGAGFADLADNLTPYNENSGVEQDTPFVGRTTGGGSDVGSVSQLKELRGNTIKWNQLGDTSKNTRTTFYGFTQSVSNNQITIDGTWDGTGASGENSLNLWLTQDYNYVAGHKYLIKIRHISGSISGTATSVSFGVSYGDGITDRITEVVYGTNEDAKQIYTFPNDFTSSLLRLYIIGLDSSTPIDFDNYTFEYQLFDLGVDSEIGSAVEFNRLFPLPYYSYNAGTLKSCKMGKFVSISMNQFDGIMEQGSINNSGQEQSATTSIRSKNYIKAIAGQTYKFEWENITFDNGVYIAEYDGNKNFITRNWLTSTQATPQSAKRKLTDNTQYIRFVFSVFPPATIEPEGHNVCLHIDWSNLNGREGYEQYVKHEYTLPDIELRRVGSVYDSITPNGIHTTRVGDINLGQQEWQYDATAKRFRTTNAVVGTNVSYSDLVLCNKYEQNEDVYRHDDGIGIIAQKGICCNNGYIFIRDNDYTDATTFTNSLSDSEMLYELETARIEQVSTYSESINVDDMGTEWFENTDTPAPEVIVPQGNYIFYIVDYKLFIDSLGSREDIKYNASKIVSQEELQNAINNIPTPSMNDKLDTSFSGVSEYDSTATYSVGNKCWYNGKIYVATDTTTGTFDSTKWTEITLNNYTDTTSAQTITGNWTFSNATISLLNSGASGNAYYSLEENQYGQFIISRTYNNNKVNMWVIDGYNLFPNGDNISNIGSTSKRVKNLYVAGTISDGTNSVSIADLAALIAYAKSQGWIQ